MQQRAREGRRLEKGQAVVPRGAQQGEGAEVEPPAAQQREHAQLQAQQEGHLDGGQEVAHAGKDLRMTEVSQGTAWVVKVATERDYDRRPTVVSLVSESDDE